MKLTFSQRFGHEPISTTLQYGSMSEELRNALWTTLYEHFFKYLYVTQSITRPHEMFLNAYWIKYKKQPIDTVPSSQSAGKVIVRNDYFSHQWHQAYSFIEFVANYAASRNQDFYDELNITLENELSSYRFVSGELVDITNKQEIEALENAIMDNKFSGVSTHLATALKLYSDSENPDYRNSIKESISAVESMAKIVTGNQKATLSDALKALEKGEKLHKALRDGFEKLYAYTSDANGIRHALSEESNLTAADAKYFLLSCTSFVNYLKSKM